MLLVLDVSGSMGVSAGGGKTRLELAQAAAVNGLAQLSDADEVGLWTFPEQGQVYWQQMIAYGQDADLDAVKRISEASRAAAYDATDPLTINAVFTNVLSNF